MTWRTLKYFYLDIASRDFYLSDLLQIWVHDCLKSSLDESKMHLRLKTTDVAQPKKVRCLPQSDWHEGSDAGLLPGGMLFKSPAGPQPAWGWMYCQVNSPLPVTISDTGCVVLWACVCAQPRDSSLKLISFPNKILLSDRETDHFN